MVLTTLSFCRNSTLPLPASDFAQMLIAVPPCGFCALKSRLAAWRCAVRIVLPQHRRARVEQHEIGILRRASIARAA